MKKTITTLILCFIIALSSVAQQQPAIDWQKSLGGTAFDYAYSIQQTTDGGYIVAGYSSSNDGDVSGNHGGADYWVLKLNHNGDIQWQKSLGGTADDYAYSIQQTIDGGYIVAGYSSSNDGDVSGNHGGIDYWVVKLTNNGDIQWQKSFGGTGFDQGIFIQQTIDGGYITAGRSASNDGDVSGNHGGADYWVIKLNNTGDIQWQKSLGGSGDDLINSIKQTTDGGYILAGRSTSNDGDVSINNGGHDYWVVKLNTTGNIEWQKSLGGTAEDWLYSIQQTSDGGYIIAGYSSSNDGDVSGNHGGNDYWIVKLNTTGNIEWQKSLGGSSSDIAYSTQQTSDGGYFVVGRSFSNDGDVSGNHGGFDYWVVKLNTTGNIEWQKSFGGSSTDIAYSTQQTSDGGYIIAGYSISNDGDVSGNHGGYDYWVVKLRMCNITYNTIAPIACGSYSLNSQTYTTSGTYTQTFINAAGCDSVLTINLTINPIPSLIVNANNVSCFGGSNGSATVTVTGGTSTFNYNWQPNGGSQAIANNLSAGIYTVTVTDINGCFSQDSITVIQPSIALSSSVTIVSNASCGNLDGSAYVTASGGTNPYTYLWSNGTTINNNNTLLAGTYSITVTDANNCVSTSTFSINNTISHSAPSICSVTVDSISQNNLIIWDKAQITHRDTVLIYRDIANNNFQLIGRVPYDSLSVFVDNKRTLYAANGDPNVSSWRYKISVKDSCSNESAKSLYHQSLFIQNSNGNFSWNDYRIEGESTPITSLQNYVFERDNISNGNWQTIQTLSASSLAYTDNQYFAFQNTANWRVETLWNITCSPTLRVLNSTQTTIIKSKSNILNNQTVSVSENELFDSQIFIYPNPTSNNINVQINSSLINNATLELYDATGKLIAKQKVLSELTSININNIADGIYSLRFIAENKQVVKRIVKQQ